MRFVITILLLSVCSIGFGQTIYTTDHINTIKQSPPKEILKISKKGFEYTLTGLIEVDGHTIRNDTCRYPFKLIVDLKGSKIVRTDQSITYSERDCETPNCEIIHLEKVGSGLISIRGWTFSNN